MVSWGQAGHLPLRDWRRSRAPSPALQGGCHCKREQTGCNAGQCSPLGNAHGAQTTWLRSLQHHKASVPLGVSTGSIYKTSSLSSSKCHRSKQPRFSKPFSTSTAHGKKSNGRKFTSLHSLTYASLESFIRLSFSISQTIFLGTHHVHPINNICIYHPPKYLFPYKHPFWRASLLTSL